MAPLRAHGVFINTALSVLTRTLGLFLAFFTIGLVTRVLGPEGAGQYFTALAYAGVAGVLANMGLYPALLRDLSQPDNDEVLTLSNFLSLRIVSLTLLLGILAPAATLLLPYTNDMRWNIVLASWSILFLSANSLLVAVFQKHLRMAWVSGAEVCSRFAQAGATWYLLTNGYGVRGAMIAAIVAAAANFGILAWASRRYIPYRPTYNPAAWRKITAGALPLAAATVFSFVYLKADTIMLSLFQGEHAVGVYGVAYKFLEILAAYPPLYIGLVVPGLSHALRVGEDAFRGVAQQAFDALMLTGTPVLIGGALIAEDLMPLFGQGYAASADVLRILLVAVAAIFLGSLYTNILIVRHAQKTLSTVYFLGMIGNVAINFIAIPRWSYAGAAWVTLATEIGVTTAIAAWLHAHNVFTPSLRYMPRVAAAAACMAVIVLALSPLSLWIRVLAGAATYVLAGGFFGAAPLLRSLTTSPTDRRAA